MIQIKFKNLESSELAKEAVLQKIEPFFEKFEALRKSQLTFTLEMQNSPNQAGPDLFIVSLQINEGQFKGIRISKQSANLYTALQDVSEHLLESLNRSLDKARVKNRNQNRKLLKAANETI